MNNKIPCGGFYLSDTLGVDENGKLGVNGGEPYKSLVTDGEGGVKWEDRLAYEVRTMILDNVVVDESGYYLPKVNYNGTDKALTDDNIGDTYIVTINGVEYRTVLQKKYTQYWNTYYYLGSDPPAVANNMSGNEFPFSIYILGSNNEKDISEYFTLDKDTLPHTIIVEKYTTKQIDEKYLPATTKYVKITQTIVDGNETFIADRTYADILQDIVNGVNVVVIYDDYVYQLVGTTSKGLIFCQFIPLDLTPAVYSLIAIQPNGNILVSEVFLPEYYRAVCSNVPLVVASSTSGSSKKFKITVNDAGTISATEV